MGKTHGTGVDDEFRKCTKCGIVYKNMPLYFNYTNKSKGTLSAVCKECTKKINKEKRKQIEESNKNKDLYYDYDCECKKCKRVLPRTQQYFPVDLGCKDGLRSICRECNPSYGRFLKDGESPNTKWSDAELDLLKKVYKDYTGQELIEKFFPKRTIRSVESMASVLNISGKTEEAYKRSRAYQAEIVRDKLTGRVITPAWRQKISETKKEYFKTHDGWWKGKKRSKEQCKFISELKKAEGKWKGSKNPRHITPLNGEDNGRWKGGITDTYRELRSDTKDWQNKSMEFCNYKCIITNGEFDNVHHTTPFRDIVDYCFNHLKFEVKESVSDYTTENFEKLRKELKDLHIWFGYGACLSKEVHKLFHDNYGYTNFTPYDFLDFVYRIDFGEFDDWFDNNKLNININYSYIEYLENILISLEEIA